MRPPMNRQTAPRIYCIPASEAPIVAVFRRGPTRWSHVGRWDVAQGTYEPGAWLNGRLFPRRSDLSPDGRYLCYVAHKPTATWDVGDVYVAISKLPWLTALRAFPTDGTWTRGFHFTADGRSDLNLDPPLPIPYGLQAIRAEQFATERRRGWVEAPDCPPRDAGDHWDERRNVRMRKGQPGGIGWLGVERVDIVGRHVGTAQAVDGLQAHYWVEEGSRLTLLDDLQWADWDRDGRLLTATRAGHLQIRLPHSSGWRILSEIDLSSCDPTPMVPPEDALQW